MVRFIRPLKSVVREENGFDGEAAARQYDDRVRRLLGEEEILPVQKGGNKDKKLLFFNRPRRGG